MTKKIAGAVRNTLLFTAAAPILFTVVVVLLAAFFLIWLDDKANGREFEPPFKEL